MLKAPLMAEKASNENMSAEEQTALSVLLEANGFTQEDLSNTASPIQELEMFLQEYPKMVAFNYFPCLKTLKLIDQCIEKIEGLSSCPRLEKLWLMENKIASIDGLEACTGLRELYLYSNRITAITGLDHLTGLQVLWLADNYIRSIIGLSNLQQLRQLNLARNDIATIGTSLLPNSALTSLNLADNKISSFQDVAGLSKLTGLQELCLAEPFWGDCPVAGLCNYQTFVLYLLPQLTSLDTLLLAEETKAAACATFTKKQLYYNMRIRTLRRAVAGLARQAKTGCQVEASRWVELQSRLAHAAKGLERRLQHTPSSEQQVLQGQLRSIQTAVQAVLGRQEQLAAELAIDTQASSAALEAAVGRLQLELGSGGNIRLEEARPDDAWMSSCQELLRSKLITEAEPGGGCGITDVQMLSAVRIHNRHVRLQFEKLLDSIASNGSNENKQCTDYLFYGEHPLLPGELMHVAQHGFRPCSEYSSMGLDGAVRLANCVNLADQLRIQQALDWPAASCAKGSSTGGQQRAAVGSAYGLEGQLLLCKVYLGSTLQKAEGHVQLISKPGVKKLYGKDGQLQPAACLDGTKVEAKQYPGTTAVYRTAVTEAEVAGSTSGSSSKHKPIQQVLTQHRTWYVFDNTAVMPEYLITFRYTVKPGSVLAAGSYPNSFAVDGLLLAGIKSQQDPLLRLCAHPISNWLQSGQQQHQRRQQGPQQAIISHSDPAAVELEQECTALLQAAAAAAPEQHLAVVTPASLAAFVGGQQLSSLTYISLHSCGLTSCEGLLGHLPSLCTLVLSFNKLTGLAGIRGTAVNSSCHLVSLDVSHNQISSWSSSWLIDCPQLTVLDASYNQLEDIKHVDQLTRSAAQLLQLDLRNNPIQHHKAYQLRLASTLPKLQQLDGRATSNHAATDGILVPAMLKAGATQWHSETGPVAILPAAGAGDWRLLLHSLTLEGRGLTSLTGVAAAARLLSASFADNLLTGLTGLAGCSQLKELNLSNNLITEVAPLSCLSSLRQLDLSFNAVSSLLPLAPLTGLSQLSVEGNQLPSLAGLSGMSSLLELYAAGNALQDIKEAERLSVLPRLVILDLAGNPMAAPGACEDYRHLLLYRLRHLKVLDGVPAEAAELATARAKYSGRLTLSFLEEQLGSSCSLSAIRSLDISGLRIKDVGAVFAPGGPFSSLSELVLDNNAISSLAPLRGLTALAVLKICNNRLGEADPANISFAAGPTAGALGGLGMQQQQQQAGQQLQSLLPNLQVLHIPGNGLTSLKPLQLQYLPALRSLFVQGNELQRLDGLEGLEQLRELVADKNKIRVLEADALAPLARLRELRLEDNMIRTLALSGPAAAPPAPPAAGTGGDSNIISAGSSLGSQLPSLCVLQLGGNRLADMADLDRLGGLPSLLEVALGGNPLARKQVYRPLLISRCPKLQVIDSQQVTEEERRYAESMFAIPPPDTCPTDAAGLLASAADGMGGWAPLTMAAAAAGGSPIRAAVAAAAPGKLSAMAMPAVLNYDAFAQLAANSAAGLQVAGAGALQLPGIVSSVPSIQSGVLVLSGAAAFGLEGMSIGAGGSSNGRSGSPASWSGGAARQQRPVSGKRGAGGSPSSNGSIGAANGKQQLLNGVSTAGTGSPVQLSGNSQGSNVRRVMGAASNSSGSGSGGFPVRQVAYRGY